MKYLNLWIYLLITVFIISCQNSKPYNNNNLFETRHPSIEEIQTFKTIEGVDIPGYYNLNKDTTVIYYLNHEKDRVIGKQWAIEVDSLNNKSILKLIANIESDIQIISEQDDFTLVSLNGTSYEVIKSEVDNLLWFLYSYPKR